MGYKNVYDAGLVPVFSYSLRAPYRGLAAHVVLPVAGFAATGQREYARHGRCAAALSAQRPPRHATPGHFGQAADRLAVAVGCLWQGQT